MLIDKTKELADLEVGELLGLAVHDDETALAAAKEMYGSEDSGCLLRLYQEEGETIGLIGFCLDSFGQLNIKHISVYPEFRNQGFGRALILEALMEQSPDTIVAEVDEDAADFYRNIGFIVTSKGTDGSGAERFECIYHAVESEDEY